VIGVMRKAGGRGAEWQSEIGCLTCEVSSILNVTSPVLFGDETVMQVPDYACPPLEGVGGGIKKMTI
jgi:hypothetical protein